uniref:DNA-directed RNA polymerase I subunit D n=1 Tax=Panagrolaimus sp. PS1159 TaxID=55785 RepID=A0AC35G3J2_9BILA
MAKSFAGRIEILDEQSYEKDRTMLSLLVQGEDHTLGNALSHTLSDMDGVEFAGYNVPHPLEDAIMIRIQTKPGYNAGKVLLQALDILETIFQSIGEKFNDAYKEFKSS